MAGETLFAKVMRLGQGSLPQFVWKKKPLDFPDRPPAEFGLFFDQEFSSSFALAHAYNTLWQLADENLVVTSRTGEILDKEPIAAILRDMIKATELSRIPADYAWHTFGSRVPVAKYCMDNHDECKASGKNREEESGIYYKHHLNSQIPIDQCDAQGLQIIAFQAIDLLMWGNPKPFTPTTALIRGKIDTGITAGFAARRGMEALIKLDRMLVTQPESIDINPICREALSLAAKDGIAFIEGLGLIPTIRKSGQQKHL